MPPPSLMHGHSYRGGGRVAIIGNTTTDGTGRDDRYMSSVYSYLKYNGGLSNFNNHVLVSMPLSSTKTFCKYIPID